MTIRTTIKNHERGLLFREGNFAGILAPGRHTNLARLWSADEKIDVFSTLTTRIEHPLLDTFIDARPSRPRPSRSTSATRSGRWSGRTTGWPTSWVRAGMPSGRRRTR